MNYIVFQSSRTPKLKSQKIPLNYKPNNPDFATQGAVGSSSYTNRLKYNTITKNGIQYTNSNGNNMSNILAYGVSTIGYESNIKNIIGVPAPCTPIFPKGQKECSPYPKSHYNV